MSQFRESALFEVIDQASKPISTIDRALKELFRTSAKGKSLGDPFSRLTGGARQGASALKALNSEFRTLQRSAETAAQAAQRMIRDAQRGAGGAGPTPSQRLSGADLKAANDRLALLKRAMQEGPRSAAAQIAADERAGEARQRVLTRTERAAAIAERREQTARDRKTREEQRAAQDVLRAQNRVAAEVAAMAARERAKKLREEESAAAQARRMLEREARQREDADQREANARRRLFEREARDRQKLAERLARDEARAERQRQSAHFRVARGLAQMQRENRRAEQKEADRILRESARPRRGHGGRHFGFGASFASAGDARVGIGVGGLAAGGALALGAISHVAIHAAHVVVEGMKEHGIAREKAHQSGMTPDELSNANRVAQALAAKYNLTSAAQNLVTYTELGAVSHDHGVKAQMTDWFAKRAQLAAGRGQDVRKVEEGQNQIIKALDILGLMKPDHKTHEVDTKKLFAFADKISAVQQIEGSNLTDAAVKNAAKYLKSTGTTITAEGFQRALFYAAETGGSTAGNEIFAFDRALGSTMTKKSRIALLEAGLIQGDSKGHYRKVAEKEFNADPLKWMVDHVGGAMRKKGFEASDADQAKAFIDGLRLKGVASNVVSKALAQAAERERQLEAANRARVDEKTSLGVVERSPDMALKGVSNAAGNIGAAAVNGMATKPGENPGAVVGWFNTLSRDLNSVAGMMNGTHGIDWKSGFIVPKDKKEREEHDAQMRLRAELFQANDKRTQGRLISERIGEIDGVIGSLRERIARATGADLGTVGERARLKASLSEQIAMRGEQVVALANLNGTALQAARALQIVGGAASNTAQIIKQSGADIARQEAAQQQWLRNAFDPKKQSAKAEWDRLHFQGDKAPKNPAKWLEDRREAERRRLDRVWNTEEQAASQSPSDDVPTPVARPSRKVLADLERERRRRAAQEEKDAERQKAFELANLVTPVRDAGIQGRLGFGAPGDMGWSRPVAIGPLAGPGKFQPISPNADNASGPGMLKTMFGDIDKLFEKPAIDLSATLHTAASEFSGAGQVMQSAGSTMQEAAGSMTSAASTMKAAAGAMQNIKISVEQTGGGKASTGSPAPPG